MESETDPPWQAGDEGRVCAVCGRALDHVRDKSTGEETWIHGAWERFTGAEDDHPVVPVKRGEVMARDRCDFCLAEDAPWALPVKAFEMDQALSMNPDWMACDDCAACIERNDWRGLRNRALAAWEQRHGMTAPAEIRDGISAQYLKVRKNVTGALRRKAV